MDALIDLARGPMFRIAFALMVLGLLYRVATTVSHIAASWWRAGDRRVPTKDVAIATIGAVIFFADNVREQLSNLAEEIGGGEANVGVDIGYRTQGSDTYDLSNFSESDNTQ